MLDPNESVVHQGSSSDTEDQRSSSNNEIKKTCADCGTSKTPLWRGGPAGPKSLCNACGIRSRKKRRVILGINKEDKKSSSSSSSTTKKLNNSNTTSINNGGAQINGNNLKQTLMAIAQDVLTKRSTVGKHSRKRLREEEQAAVMLMALSYGSVVYA